MKFFLIGLVGSLGLVVNAAMADTPCPESVPLTPFSIAKASMTSVHGFLSIFKGIDLPAGYEQTPGEKISGLLDITSPSGEILAQSFVGQISGENHRFTVFKNDQQLATALTGTDPENKDVETADIKVCGKIVAKLDTAKTTAGDKELYSLSLINGTKLTYALDRHAPQAFYNDVLVNAEIADGNGQVVAKITEKFSPNRYGAQLSEVKVEPAADAALDQRVAEILATQIVSRFR